MEEYEKSVLREKELEEKEPETGAETEEESQIGSSLDPNSREFYKKENKKKKKNTWIECFSCLYEYKSG